MELPAGSCASVRGSRLTGVTRASGQTCGAHRVNMLAETLRFTSEKPNIKIIWWVRLKFPVLSFHGARSPPPHSGLSSHFSFSAVPCRNVSWDESEQDFQAVALLHSAPTKQQAKMPAAGTSGPHRSFHTLKGLSHLLPLESVVFFFFFFWIRGLLKTWGWERISVGPVSHTKQG